VRRTRLFEKMNVHIICQDGNGGASRKISLFGAFGWQMSMNTPDIRGEINFQIIEMKHKGAQMVLSTVKNCWAYD
jgi:hypothetical protein